MRIWNLKAVIFDIDDTLVSEYDYVISGHRAAAKYLSKTGLVSMTAEEIFDSFMELASKSYSGVYNRFFEAEGLEAHREIIGDLVDIYVKHDPQISPYSDVKDTLEALRKRDIKLGIISDGDPGRQKRKLKVCGLEGYFDQVIITDELGDISYRKPDIRSFELMAKGLGVEPSEMLYIGDNPSKDFHISMQLPVKTARIIREKGIYADRDYLDDIRETYRIDSLRDILELV